MEKKTGIIVLITAIVALCVACASLVIALSCSCAGGEKDVQYVLYLGTNDKDTDLPVYTPEESVERAKAVLIDRFGGYTIQEAHGGWIGDDGTVYQEYTIVIYLSDTTLDAVHEACDELIGVFNQSSILIQANETTTEFYSGK